MHPLRDLRPQHFLFVHRLQTLLPEVDQEVKWERFKELSFAMFRCYRSLASLCMVSISTHRLSLHVFDTGEYHQPASILYSIYSRLRECHIQAGCDYGAPYATKPRAHARHAILATKTSFSNRISIG